MFSLEEILQATKANLISQSGRRNCFCGISLDSRTIKRGELFIAIKGNNFDSHDFLNAAIKKGAKGAVVSRKLNLKLPDGFVIFQVKDTTIALGDIASFHRQRFKIPVVAVTGSCGKTTTKEMLSFLLSKRFNCLSSKGTNNNQIGVPLTLLKLKPSHEIVILELGTNHPGEIAYLTKMLKPTLGVITNIAPSHLEFFKNQPNVFKEKYSLFKDFSKGQAAIINNDDRYLNKINYKKTKYKIISFGIHKKSVFLAKGIKIRDGTIKFLLNGKIPLKLNTLGFHNLYNCLAAIACCKYFHLDYNCIKKALPEFRFPPGRLEIKKFKNLRVIDDTYNANPLSFKNAIDALTAYDSLSRKVLVCADMLELGAKSKELHYSVGRYAANSGVDFLISVGRLAKFYETGAKEAGLADEDVFHYEDSESAAKKILSLLKPNDICLVKGSRRMQMEKIVETLKKAKIK